MFTIHMHNPKTLNLYIHVPFCKQKCLYCAFFSKPDCDSYIPDYFKALETEILSNREILKTCIIRSIYIGGGTPSLCDASLIASLIDICKKTFNLPANCEISIETNPDSLTNQKLITYKKAGINRISIGLQAWQNPLLFYLGRTYKNDVFLKALNSIKKTGFRNINVDIIFGIPGQTMDNWQETLEKTVSFGIQHISCYSLELDNTSVFGIRFKQGLLSPVSETLDRKMYHYAVNYLKNNGYIQYEISNFAKRGYECRHNTDFWQYKQYIGIGAGAHSFFNNYRYSHKESIPEYIQYWNQDKNKKVKTSRHYISPKHQTVEAIVQLLRLNEGIRYDDFNNKHSVDLRQKYAKTIAQLTELKLIHKNKRYLKLTVKGKDLINQITLAFI